MNTAKNILGLMSSAKKLLNYHLVKHELQQRSFNVEDSVTIFSMPRGGSTWLMRMLQSLPGMVANWEPLSRKGPFFDKNDWALHPYIPTDRGSGADRELAEQILSFKDASPWSAKFTSPSNVREGERVLTKFVRANLILPWIVKEFDFKHKPIFLLRHPIATCVSNLKAFPEKYARLNSPMEADWLNNNWYNEHRPYLESLNAGLEWEVAIWSLTNLYVTRNSGADKWLTVYYEDLVLNPEQELQRILDHLNLPFNLESFGDKDFRKKRRAKSSLRSSEVDPKEQLKKWQDEVSDSELHRIQSILDHFGIREYNAFETLPVVSSTK